MVDFGVFVGLGNTEGTHKGAILIDGSAEGKELADGRTEGSSDGNTLGSSDGRTEGSSDGNTLGVLGVKSQDSPPTGRWEKFLPCLLPAT